MAPKAKLLIIGGAEDKGPNEPLAPLDLTEQKKNSLVMKFLVSYCRRQIRK